MTLAQGAILAGQLTAILVCLEVIRRTYKALRYRYTAAKVFFTRANEAVALANYQFQNNGGESLLDLAQRTAKSSQENARLLAEVWTVVDGLSDSHSELSEKFETHLILQADVALEGARAIQAAMASQPPD